MLLCDSDARSWYAASAGPAPDDPLLEGELEVDVCVVGGGLTGCSTALALAERGYRVALLEAHVVGWGASGRSGGQIIFGYSCDMRGLRAQVGPGDARALWQFSLDALALVKQRVAQFAIDCDLRAGHLHVAVTRSQRRELQAWADELGRVYAYPGLEYLQGADLRRQVDSPRYLAGLFDPASGHLHPLKFTRGVAAAARGAGARIFQHSPVLRIEPGARTLLHTARGRVRCHNVAVCTNAYAGPLGAPPARAAIAVGSYIVATEPLGAGRAAQLLPGNAAVADLSRMLDYYRVSADRRLLFGARVGPGATSAAALGPTMQRRIQRVFPTLAGVRIDFAWGGYVSATRNRAPHLGRTPEGLYFAHGFSGHGMALTSLAGEVLAAAIAGDCERFDVFARIPHRPIPTGRRLRPALLGAALIWHRVRDLF